jgi:hypothetical protein
MVADSTSSVIAPQQWGEKQKLRENHDKTSGSKKDGTPLFDNIADIIGGKPPDKTQPTARDWFLENLPNTLLIELPGGKKDLGIIDITVTVPTSMPCPSGTQEVP